MGKPPIFHEGAPRWRMLLGLYRYGRVSRDLMNAAAVPGRWITVTDHDTGAILFPTTAQWWRTTVENRLWRTLMRLGVWVLHEEGGYYRDGFFRNPLWFW